MPSGREVKSKAENEPPVPAAGSGSGGPAAGSPASSAPKNAPLNVHHPRSRLGDILVEEAVITPAQLAEALKKREAAGGFVGQSLVDLGYIDQSTLVSFLVKQCRIPHISLLDYEVSNDLFDLIPKETCLQFHLLPIDKLGKIFTVAMVDPLDIQALEHIRAACPDLKIKPILCDWNHYLTVSQRIFGQQASATPQVTADTFGLSPTKPQKPPEDSPPDESELAAVDAAVEALVEQAATSALQEAVPAEPELEAEEQPEPATAPAKGPVRGGAGAEPGELSAAAVDERVRATVEKTLTSLLGAAGSAPSTAMAQQISDTVQEAVRQALAGAKAGADDGGALLGEGIQKALAEAMTTLAQQEARLIELTQAATQAAQAAEAAARSVRNGGGDAPSEDKEPVNLQPFPAKKAPGARRPGAARLSKPELDALEALEGPGMRSRSDDRVRAALDSEVPLQGYTFEEFVSGKSSSFAVTVGQAIATDPGGELSPLYIHGDVGLGKTHLINAVGNAVLENNPDLRVGYVSASRFSRHCSDALQNRTVDAFRDHYCHWDVLILDDIQFLAGRPEAQEEMLHILDALLHEGRQVIIAGDRAPDALADTDRSLLSRFAGGIVAALEAPEHDVRISILRRHADKAGQEVTDEVLALVASRIPNDMRKMSGALRKVIAFASLVGQDITCELANEILSHLGVVEAA
ncbi:MAG: ATP-binding protein [Candidatus Hydrogenedentes bacterium]|nr:ATP-binding protein [Candidatus Hydrogenedentota bacterium]